MVCALLGAICLGFGPFLHLCANAHKHSCVLLFFLTHARTHSLARSKKKAEVQKKLLTKELEQVGIRLNKKRPDISIKVKKTGGTTLNGMCDLTYVDVQMVREILSLYKIHNADVLFRENYKGTYGVHRRTVEIKNVFWGVWFWYLMDASVG